jgi:acetyltransferase
MTIRNLEVLLKPRSLVLIGASDTPHALGEVVGRNLLRGGFSGPVYLVNPHHDTVMGVKCYPSVEQLPAVPELAVIVTPPHTVPGIIATLGQRGTRAAVVLSAGFAELPGGEGLALQQRMLEAAQPHLVRVAGPNCLGVLSPGTGLNASFAHLQPLPGRLAFVAQSGAMITAVLDWATARRIGFSHIVSLGDMADVDFGDMLDYLTADTRTRAILMYIEAVTHARKFMSAARAAARCKPVVVVKGGRHPQAARAAASHTGALAGSDAVYEAAFRRAGILRVADLQALFDAVETLSASKPFQGERLAILTNGGGMGVLATDALLERGGTLAELSPQSLQHLDATLPRTWSRANPVDIIGDADGARFAAALRTLSADAAVDAVLVMHCPNAVVGGTETAQAVVDVARDMTGGYAPKGLFTCWLGEGAAAGARQLFTDQAIPTYRTPSEAVRGFLQMVRYRKGQEMLMETPPSLPERFAPDRAAARAALDHALACQAQWLSPEGCRQVLEAYGIALVPSLNATTAEEAARLSQQLPGPAVLKIRSPDILHKTEVGGVALDLSTPAAVLDAAQAMIERLGHIRPDARLEGFVLQPMMRPSHARELILGVTCDPVFGPVILFGHGGTAVELIADSALALPPLNLHLARELMSRTRVVRLLSAHRGLPAADVEGLALALVKLSQLVCDFAEIQEVDINPLLAGSDGVLALDARIRVAPAASAAADRLAIRPYPSELEETLTLPDGMRLRLRPIRPEDEPGLQEIFSRLSPEEITFRFLHPMRSLPRQLAARLSQIDYDREIALVLEESGPGGAPSRLHGSVRISADPDNRQAEFAILIHRDLTGLGLGPLLMRRIIDLARRRGVGELYGEVLPDNRAMLGLAKRLGFSVVRDPDDPGVMRVTLALQPGAPVADG